MKRPEDIIRLISVIEKRKYEKPEKFDWFFSKNLYWLSMH